MVEVVQLVERQIVDLVVVGSSPIFHPIYRGIAKSVRHQILILALRRFESCYPCQFYFENNNADSYKNYQRFLYYT